MVKNRTLIFSVFFVMLFAMLGNSAFAACGDGACQNVACMALDCPAAESFENCPQDCGTTANCNNGVLDVQEKDVDCGGICWNRVNEVCDGKDNNQDCQIDENCGVTGIPASPSGSVERAPSSSSGGKLIAVPFVPAPVGSSTPAQVPAPLEPSSEKQGSMTETSESSSETPDTSESTDPPVQPTLVSYPVRAPVTVEATGNVEAEARISEDSWESQPASPATVEEQPAEQVAVMTELPEAVEKDSSSKSFLSKIFGFFSSKKGNEVSEKPADIAEAPAHSESASASSAASKEEVELPQKSAEKNSFFARLLSAFR